ncbi:hypothetical protein IWZ01DRAFT_36653 [Phyllosticta capitalensis]
MADPLSIISFVGGTATAGFELSKTLYQLVDTVKNRKEEMERIADRIEDTAMALESLQDLLGRAKGLYKPELLKSARSIVQRFERLMDGIKSHIQKEGRMQSVKWIWRRLKVEPLVTEMGGLTSLLTMQIVVMREVVDIDSHKGVQSDSQNEKAGRAVKASRFRKIAEAVMLRNRQHIIKLQELESSESSEFDHRIRKPRYIEPRPSDFEGYDEKPDQTGQLQSWIVSDKVVASRTAAWLQQMLFDPAHNDSAKEENEEEKKPPVWNGPTVEEARDSEASDHEPTSPSNLAKSHNQDREVNSLVNDVEPRDPELTLESSHAAEKMPLPDRKWNPDPVLTQSLVNLDGGAN